LILARGRRRLVIYVEEAMLSSRARLGVKGPKVAEGIWAEGLLWCILRGTSLSIIVSLISVLLERL
jgi:hypothetical protein